MLIISGLLQVYWVRIGEEYGTQNIQHNNKGFNLQYSLNLSFFDRKSLYQVHHMRGSRNFRQGGGGPGQYDKKSTDNVFFFLVLSLFFRSQMVYIKENYHFQGSHITCDFPGGGGGSGPLSPPPSGSALASYIFSGVILGWA